MYPELLTRLLVLCLIGLSGSHNQLFILYIIIILDILSTVFYCITGKMNYGQNNRNPSACLSVCMCIDLYASMLRLLLLQIFLCGGNATTVNTVISIIATFLITTTVEHSEESKLLCDVHFAGVYGRWGFVEPNNRDGYQRCAALDNSVEFKFVDERCEKACGFVCDIRAYFVLLSYNVDTELSCRRGSWCTQSSVGNRPPVITTTKGL